MTTTDYAHIELQASGMPHIAGTRISVQRIALDYTLHGLAADEIAQQYEGLSLGQVFSALAYYFDHKDVMDRQIGRYKSKLASGRVQWADSQAKLRADLQAKGLRP